MHQVVRYGQALSHCMVLFKLHLPTVHFNEERKQINHTLVCWMVNDHHACYAQHKSHCLLYRVKSCNWTLSQLVLQGQRSSWGMLPMNSTRRRGSQREGKSKCNSHFPGSLSPITTWCSALQASYTVAYDLFRAVNRCSKCYHLLPTTVTHSRLFWL